MGNKNNGLVYLKLINATVLYFLTTVLYFFIQHLTFYGRWSIVFVFDPPIQKTVIYKKKWSFLLCILMSLFSDRLYTYSLLEHIIIIT